MCDRPDRPDAATPARPIGSKLPVVVIVLVATWPGLAPVASAQEPVVIGPPVASSPVSVPVHRGKGPLHRAVSHASDALHTYVIGDPARFHEPPLGQSVREVNALMECRAEQHNFTLYRTDFFAGSERLTPNGFARLTRMSRRLDGWLGPLVIEADPHRPALAEQRKAAVFDLLQPGNPVLTPERLVVAGSPYTGASGDAAGLTYPIMIQRGARAQGAYALPPMLQTVSDPTSPSGFTVD